MAERWRVGRKVPIHLYRQIGDEPSDSDPPIGTMLTVDDARLAVDALARADHDRSALMICRQRAEAAEARAERLQGALCELLGSYGSLVSLAKGNGVPVENAHEWDGPVLAREALASLDQATQTDE